jgi:membrane-associated phospholipid phosphatase
MSTLSANLPRFSYDERPEAYQARMLQAYNQCYNTANYNIELENNGDITNVPNYAAMFTKTFAHDPTTGIATAEGQQSFQTLVQATQNGQQATYNAIERFDPNLSSLLTNPQASAAWYLCGHDGSLIPLVVPPTLASKQAGADLTENYVMRICDQVLYPDFGTGMGTDMDTINGGSKTLNACAVLNAYGSAFQGPKINGEVTPQTLFRGNGLGELDGPYISQYAWHDLHLYDQALLPVKQYMAIPGQRRFGVTWANFVDIENGLVPVPYGPNDFLPNVQYIINSAMLGTLVHKDMLSDPYVYAQNVLFNNNAPLAPNLPYYNGTMRNEAGFATMFYPDIAGAVGAVAIQALKTAWAHKWRASLRLRPEAMAGLVHQAKVTDTNPYNLNDIIFGTPGNIDLLNWVLQTNLQQVPANPNNGTYLLSQLFPEGSPNHPSYPAGHATVAGACTTVLKAFFNDRAFINSFMTPVKPDPNNPTQLIALTDGEGANLLTLGGELNKWASNIAIGRNHAGVHYRTDADASLLLGEQVAIYFLQDWASTYQEQNFTGFELTKRDGTRIRITATQVTVIS